MPRLRVFALVGNPNTGKTSLFNALTGFRRRVANYPGVTVEVARGMVRGAAGPIELLDLPGTYSLAAVSPDEMVVADALLGRDPRAARPDGILAILDGSNLQRNLYLLSQLLDLGLPVVVALNMVDVAAGRGISVDSRKLAAALGTPVVPVVATDQSTVAPLIAALDATAAPPSPRAPASLPAELEAEVARLDGLPEPLPRGEVLRILLDRNGHAAAHYIAAGGSGQGLEEARSRLAQAGVDSPAIEVRARYRWINRMLDGVVERAARPAVTWSDRIDRVLTHKVGGAAFLLLVLYIVFESIFLWSGPLMRGIELTFEWLGHAAGRALPAGVLSSLVTDGLIGGVGGVLTFLPQIMLLFAFIAILEDCGYMARAAFMMDRIMRGMGLSGRAFIPMLSGFACAVPAIMGARTISDRRERLVTILVIPFMSCSARLPVYLLLISALFPDQRLFGGVVRVQALAMLGMYLVGVVVAIPIAWALKKASTGAAGSSFLLELPSYKMPRLRTIWQRVHFAGRDFIVRAGTIILLVNLIVWALAYFPHAATTRTRVEQEAAASNWTAAQQQAALSRAYLHDSVLGRMGHAIEPAIAPLGWDWRIGVSVIASFPAREVIIATLGTLFDLGGDANAGSAQLRAALQTTRRETSDQRLFTLPVALSIMVFFALCAQCASTLVVMARETGGWKWPLISFAGMTSIAYLAAWITALVAGALLETVSA